MRFLADENFPLDAVDVLRKEGHQVGWIREDDPGSTDEKVLARAQLDNRILVTFDKDFGELAFRSRLPASCGIVLFRISTTSSEHVARTVRDAISSRTDWSGHFSVVDNYRIRMIPLLE